MGQWVYIYGKFNILIIDLNNLNKIKDVIISKNLNKRVINVRSEAKWSNHGQVENL